jgi:putative transposase
MGKSFIDSRRVQADADHHSVTVQLPLPMLSTLADVRERFFALCVNAGREVLEQMMEQDRTAICGPRGVPNPQRTAGRTGSMRSEITLGGRRITMRRWRARSVDGEEIAVPSFLWAANRDPLNAHTVAAIAAGVSTRKYRASLEAVAAGETERAISKSAVSRRFVALSADLLSAWLSRPLNDLELCAVLIDGIAFAERCVVIALGVSQDGYKHVLGLCEGNTENATVVDHLLDDLSERGLRTQGVRLFVIDGSKALRKAIRQHFGERALVQRCQVHKRRNVLDHLPKSMHASVRRAMQQAYDGSDAELAQRQLERLAHALQSDHPGAAASLCEGLDETLTLQRLGITGSLYRSLRSTNPIENLNGSVAQFTRNVKRWRDGAMVVRWVGSALHAAQQRFRRLRGYKQMPQLIAALAKHQQIIGTARTKVDTKKKAA